MSSMGDAWPDDGMDGSDWSFLGSDPGSSQPFQGIIPVTVAPSQVPSIIPASSQQDQSAALMSSAAYSPAPALQDPNTATFSDAARSQLAEDALNSELNRRGIAGKIYSDLHDALSDWADAAQPVQGRLATEVNSAVYAMPGGGWQIGPAHSNGSLCPSGDCDTMPPTVETVPGGGMRWGYIHTHAENKALGASDLPDSSPSRQIVTNPLDNAAFAVLPDGRIYGWNLGMGWVGDTQQDLNNPSDQYLMRPAKYPFGQ